MECRFKDYLDKANGKCEKPYCKVIFGECQYLSAEYDLKCNISAAYYKLSADED